MMKQKNNSGWLMVVGRQLQLALVLAPLLGCGAGVAPKQLLSARDAYAAADKSKAKELAPVQLEEAKQALARADQAFSDGEDQAHVSNLAYIAEKKAQIAISAGNKSEAERKLDQAEKAGDLTREDIMAAQARALKKTQSALEEERREKLDVEREKEAVAKASQEEIAKTKKELEAERKARLAAEKKLSAALKSLHEIAQVTEEKRGVVITLSGSVLFTTGKYKLLPIAEQRLDEVAKALKDQGFKAIVVEGHTDSKGSASKNVELSKKRAEEVRSYLITQGIGAAEITAVGRGEDMPVADNNTAEGRANNRRVELIVTPE